MRNLNHANLMKFFLAYDHLQSRIFLLPWYQGDLDEYLTGTFNEKNFKAPGMSLEESRRPEQARYRFPTESWVWKEMLGVLDGLNKFHGIATTKTKAVHLDLKPANILISSTANLVISDCGASRVRKNNDRLTTRIFVTTEAYSPPWTEREKPASDPLPMMNQTFDVWSAACIMLEVMIFLMKGAAAVIEFRDERQQQDLNGNIVTARLPASRSPAFWYNASKTLNEFKHKTVVIKWLDRAEGISKLMEDDALFTLTQRLRIMFAILPYERGTIEQCLKNLQGDPSVSNVGVTLNSSSPGVALNVEQGLTLEEKVDSLHANVDLARKAYELGYIEDIDGQETLKSLSRMYCLIRFAST